MKRLLMYPALALVLCTGFYACSEDKEAPEAPEKGRIEKMTDEAAAVAVDRIQRPMERARSLDEMARQRVRGMDEAADE
ncbi:MAG: hypothetical protein SWE60_18075 [Thermodesulfobacteriota bacterium]|nr:hypothetical protein [Thermodesulfobacteriota bacterium]